MMSQIMDAYKAYSGSSYYMLFFLLALIFLFFTEKNKNIRHVFIYGSVLVIFAFLFPPFAFLIIKVLDDEIYYRTIWLFPIGIVISYTIVRIIMLQKNNGKKLCMTIMLVLLLITGGSFTYTHSHFSKAENWYKIPQEVIDICDAIMVPGQNVKAVFPENLLSYVRQYSSSVIMAFGREKLLPWFGGDQEFYYALQNKVLDTEDICRLLDEQQCTYLILPEQQQADEAFSKYGVVVYSCIGGYTIYKNESIN